MSKVPHAFAAALVAVAMSAQARELENKDVFVESAPALFLPALSGNARRLVDLGFVSSMEARLGVPTFFWAGQGAHNPPLREKGLRPEQAARSFLLDYAKLYRHKGAALADLPLTYLHDTGDGAIIGRFHRRVFGLPVFRDSIQLAMTRDLRLVAISGYVSPHGFSQVPQFQLSAGTALTEALADLLGQPLEAQTWHLAGAAGGGYEYWQLEPAASAGALRAMHVEPARVRKVLFNLADRLEEAYHLELQVGPADGVDGDYVAYVVSARDGRVLFRKNLKSHDAYTYRVWADPTTLFPYDGPQGLDATPHPQGTPNGFQAAFVPQQRVTIDHGPISTQDPWLAAGSTETNGNNADAYADLASPNGYSNGDLRASVTASLTFDHLYSMAAQPKASATQTQAAVTQLFYNVNFLHDWFYDLGFDEKSGNAQKDNFGRGGVSNDPMRAEAQDYSGSNNANMSTPSDGARPQMQMYVFDGEGDKYVQVNAGGTGKLAINIAGFGPQAFQVSADLALASDGTAPDTDACTPLQNVVTGSIVLIDRGNCTFAQKVQAAQDAGAAGVIIANNTSGGPPPLAGTGSAITIPSVSITQADGSALKAAMAQGTVNVTLLRQATVDRDGTLDNAIVTHEWGHYISNRLVGDAAGLSNQQGGGMGEGWGDFHALLLVVQKGDDQRPHNANFSGVYGLAGFTSSGGSNNGYYFGIRRLPYSTDLAKNALTFQHISNGVPLPANVPTAFGTSGRSNSEVHNTGEVWSLMLWECYAALLRDSQRLTFEEAQRRMGTYLVGGYKLTPNAPTFVEARDAVLASAFAKDPQDLALLAGAFARRGLGLKAVAPERGSTSNSPLTESFLTGSDLSLVDVKLDDSVRSCDHDGRLDGTEAGLLKVTLKNVGTGSLSQTTGKVTTTSAGVTLGNGGVLNFPASKPYGSTVATVPVEVGTLDKLSTLELKVEYTDPALAVPGNLTKTVIERVNFDITPKTSAMDDVEASPSVWTVASNPNLGDSSPWRIQAYGPTDHRWFVPNPGEPEEHLLVSPPLSVGTGEFKLTFSHRYEFEFDTQTFYDGAVIELSRDNGVTWTDIGNRATPGYTGQLDNDSRSSNPLRGRQAFVGRMTGWPALQSVTVNLGTAYAGQTVKVRFRIGSDDAANLTGWEIDDIAFSGITNTPFASVVVDKNLCGNHPPVASAGTDLTVAPAAAVTLQGSATDPDGDAVTFTWTQLEGELVTLSNGAVAQPTFTAPSTPQRLVFQLVASDGKHPSTPAQVAVVVADRPVANAGPNQLVMSGASVALDGSGSFHPRGGALTFSWKQVDGPGVALSSGAEPQPTFVAPTVDADTTLVFELTVRDGQLESEPSRVEVVVKRGGGCACTAAAPGALWLFGAGLWLLRRRRHGLRA